MFYSLNTFKTAGGWFCFQSKYYFLAPALCDFSQKRWIHGLFQSRRVKSFRSGKKQKKRAGAVFSEDIFATQFKDIFRAV